MEAPFLNEEKKSIFVMSYNVNFGFMMTDNSTIEALSVVEIIQRYSPDICCLQETNGNWEHLIRLELDEQYPFQLFRNVENWYAGGMGILSKYPFEEIGWLPPTSIWFYSSVIHVDSPIGKIQFMNLHLRPGMDANGFIPSPITFLYRSQNDRMNDIQHWYSTLDPILPTVILGDFNEGHSGIFGGKSCQWLENKGMKNAIHEFDPNTYTWRWPLQLFTLKANFDHIFYDKSLGCSTARVIEEGPSDHFPVVATLEIKIPETKLPSKHSSTRLSFRS